MLSLTLSALSLLAPAAQQDPPPGAAVAFAAREAAHHEVMHDFWMDVARAVNQPGPDLHQRLVEAWDTRKEGLTLIREQHALRMQLLQELGAGAYDLKLRAADYSADITNPYLPFVPGRTLVYERQTSEGLEHIEITALAQVQYVRGIPCRPIREWETLDGQLVEETINWVTQHQDGSVWYLGEIAQIYEGGFLSSLSGSWRYGVDGAQPGILMPAAPLLGDHYRQEFLIGVAEDVARVVAVGVIESAMGATYTNCVTTEERTPLEPDDLGAKTYAPGVGLVVEVDQLTGERLELIEVRN